MEFKRRKLARKKRLAKKSKKIRGMNRVKSRGRKRWLDPAKSSK